MKCEYSQHKKCMNNAICHLCDGSQLFEEKKPYVRRKKKHNKEGIPFEKDVVKGYNDASKTGNAAKHHINSGAIWWNPGDVSLCDTLMECKERGTTTSKGEKTFTIHLSWIQKVISEAFSAGKPHWVIPFRFKGDDRIFIIKPLDDEIAQHIKDK